MKIHPILLDWRIGTTLLIAAISTSQAAPRFEGNLTTDGQANSPCQIGSRLELFVDHYLIEELDGATLKLHQPRRAGVALKFDKSWEGITSGHVTVILDRGKYRMYYRGWPYKPELPDGSSPGQAKHSTCYAESNDGIHWMKPNVLIHKVRGTWDNNVLITDPQPVTGRFAPFLDNRPGVPDNERLKGISGGGDMGLVLFVSPDGIRWKRFSDEPILTGFAFDSQNNIFWSDAEQCYVCLFRTKKYFKSRDGQGRFVKIKNQKDTWRRWTTWQRLNPQPEIENVRYKRFRWITRMTSPDLRTWSTPVDMDFGKAPLEHLYTNQTQPYFRAPHIYIGTAARYLPGRWALTEEQEKEANIHSPLNYHGIKGGSISDAVLLTSRGGNRCDRTFLEALVRPGGDPRDWTGRSNYPARGIVPTGDKEMSMYITRNYGQPSHYLERLAFRIDGLASVHAGYSGGEMKTKLLSFKGRELILNYATSAAGSLRIEIQDQSGKPIPGFTLSECSELIGDELERAVNWKRGGDVSGLAGRPVRLRVAMRDANLYSLRFRSTP